MSSGSGTVTSTGITFSVGSEGVVMVEFETAKRYENEEELGWEYRRLEESLWSESTLEKVGTRKVFHA
jgi:hypothetical protein